MGQPIFKVVFASGVLIVGCNAAVATAADGLDRYGGRARTPQASYGLQPGDRLLTWSGKTESQAYPAAYPAQPPVFHTASAPLPAINAPVAYPDARVTAPMNAALPPGQVLVQAPVQVQALAPPQVLSRTPAPRIAVATPPGGEAQARLYSLHRDYGLEPDAAPLAPATYTTSADLAGQDITQAEPQPSPKTRQGRTAITAARLADNPDGQP